MGMMKKEYNEHKIAVEETEEGIAHLMKWGKLSFKDHTGEWVEVRTSGQPHLFGDFPVEPIPHIIEG
jgi:hypothetical protein